jgi:hypothetical protein
MKKSVPAIGAAIAALTLAVGLAGCDSNKNDTKSSTSSSASSSSKSSSSSATSTSAQASGSNETIDDYLKKNNVTSTKIPPDDPNSPAIGLPDIDGWKPLQEEKDPTIAFSNATDPSDPPKIQAILFKLSGDVDEDQFLAAASGEVKNLPGFSGGDGSRSTLAGFPASQISGPYTAGGKSRVAGQKTVLIKSDKGVFVLQLSADSPDADKNALADAMNVVDEKTTIKA